MRVLLPLLVALLAGFRLYRSPWSASALEIVPDSVEYAIGAQRFATLHSYDIVIDGVSYPPRYPPWFSVAILAPVYALAPGEIGNGILPVLAFAIAAVVAAYTIGRKLAGEWAGVLAALALLSSPVVSVLSRMIMTDVPALALGLIACALYMTLSERDSGPWRFAVAGLLAAGAFALRNVYLAVLVPFLWLVLRGRGSRASKVAALLGPSALVAAATAVYNHAAFGDWRRTGYHFWCSVPYDYANLLFSPAYVRINLVQFLSVGALVTLAFGAAGIAVLVLRKPTGRGPLLRFLLLAAVPGTVFHLFYFFPSIRFHLFALALLTVLGGAGIAVLVPEGVRRKLWFLPALLVLAVFVWPRQAEPEPARRKVAEALARETPRDAVVVSAIDPVYLEPFILRGTQRRVVPVSRGIEYASKVATPRRIDQLDPPPTGPGDHRAPALLRAGAKEAVAFTADEAPNALIEWVRSGVPVYVDASFLPRGARLDRILGNALRPEPSPTYRWLARLRLVEEPGSVTGSSADATTP